MNEVNAHRNVLYSENAREIKRIEKKILKNQDKPITNN